MNKMKKMRAALFAGFGLAVPLMVSNGVYATDPQITINNGAENLYVASGSQSSADGTASYDANANTLTLNNFNGSNITISGLDDINIHLAGENTLDMNTTDSTIPQGITADDMALNITGSGSLTVNQPDLPGFASSASIIKANSITIDSATLNLAANTKTCLSSTANKLLSLSADGGITIKSGETTLACNVAMQSEDIIVNGGTLTVNGELSSSWTISKNLTINGGKLTINAESLGLGSAMTFYGSVRINGGETNIHGGQYGINFTNLSGTLGSIGYFSISGGVLNIDNVQGGIYVANANADSYMEFAGGTTTIDAEHSAAEIIYGAENDKNILIADKMFLSPKNLSVEMTYKDYSGVWEEYNYHLVSNGTVAKSIVITDQDPEVLDADNEGEIAVSDTNIDNEEEIAVPNTSADEQKETKVKTPDTGLGTGSQNYLAAAIITLPMLLGIAIGSVRYFIRSRKSIKLDY